MRKTYQRFAGGDWLLIAASSFALPLAPLLMTRAAWYYFLVIFVIVQQLPPLFILIDGRRLLKERLSGSFIPIVVASLAGTVLLFSYYFDYAEHVEGRSFGTFLVYALLGAASVAIPIVLFRYLMQHSRSRVSPMELASAQTAGSFLVLTLYTFLVEPAVRAAGPQACRTLAFNPAPTPARSCPVPFQISSSHPAPVRPCRQARSWLPCFAEWAAASPWPWA